MYFIKTNLSYSIDTCKRIKKKKEISHYKINRIDEKFWKLSFQFKIRFTSSIYF